MPEFEQRKRKSLSRQELEEEYYGLNQNKEKNPPKSKKKRGSNSSATAKSKKTSTANSEKTQQELKQRQSQAKKSKTYAGKTSGKAPGKNYTKKQSGSAKGSSKKSGIRQGRYTLYYVLIGILAVIALAVLSNTVLFNIGVFVVNGETPYSDEEIINACGIEKGENLLRINTGRGVKNILDKLVYIESAELHRGFPNRLTISVKQAVPTVAFAYGGKYYVISQNKKLLEISDTPSDCTTVKGVTMLVKPPDSEKEGDVTTADKSSGSFSQIAQSEGITLENEAKELIPGVFLGEEKEKRIYLALYIVNCLNKYEYDKKCEINLSDTLNITVKYDDRIEIKLGTSAALEEKIYNAGRIIAEDVADNEKCTINISNPNRGVKRPIHDEKPAEVTTSASTTETSAPEEKPAAPE